MTHPTDGRHGTRLVRIDASRPGDADPAVVGAKAATLMRMADAGLPVPPGFTLSTDICGEYFDAGGRLSPATMDLLDEGLRAVEAATGRRFGAERRPLLLSVRSGAAVSMPGMLDTILNVGLSEASLGGLLRATGDPVLAWDSYRRLVRACAHLVAGCPEAELDAATTEVMRRHHTEVTAEMDVAALKELAERQRRLFLDHAGRPFPDDPRAQLADAVEAVIRSWRSERAVAYRRAEGLADRPGTAVTVQAMVFGNAGPASGSGVGFTRDPATGAHRLYVDFSIDAQGEDVVAGREATAGDEASLSVVPNLRRELEDLARSLEAAFGDAQDFEFTVEEGRLWVLQSRPAKRTALAALRIACDLVAEGRIDGPTAVDRLSGYDLERVRITRLDNPGGVAPLARAVTAGVGVAGGRVALDGPTARFLASSGSDVILVAEHADTDDVADLEFCRGMLTGAGARTSHAAVVARQLGVVCLVGCRSMRIDRNRRSLSFEGTTVAEGDPVTLDGNTGEVYPGILRRVEERPEDLLDQVRQWQHAPAG